MSEQFSMAFYAACQCFLREFGDGPYDDLRTIGDPRGPGWAMVANVTSRKETISNIPDGHIMICFNGLPCGIINPFGGEMISMGQAGSAEQDFIQWCEAGNL